MNARNDDTRPSIRAASEPGNAPSRDAPPADRVVLGAMGDDRPREKLDRLGVAALGDNELVAIVLAHGGRRRPALDLANDLLQRSDGLHGLARALHDELRAVRGIGPAKAAQLLAAIELGRRTLQRPRPPARAFLTPRAIAEYLLPRYGSRPVEQVGVALLDARRNLLKIVPLTVGTTDGSAIHPRDVFRAAIAANATAVIVFHNHPTGDPAPSADDVRVTRQLVLAGDVMGIDMLDHVILGDGRYYSFKEAGRHGG